MPSQPNRFRYTFELVVEFWITDTLKKRTVLNNMFSSTTSAGALEAKELR